MKQLVYILYFIPKSVSFIKNSYTQQFSINASLEQSSDFRNINNTDRINTLSLMLLYIKAVYYQIGMKYQQSKLQYKEKVALNERCMDAQDKKGIDIIVSENNLMIKSKVWMETQLHKKEILKQVDIFNLNQDSNVILKLKFQQESKLKKKDKNKNNPITRQEQNKQIHIEKYEKNDQGQKYRYKEYAILEFIYPLQSSHLKNISNQEKEYVEKMVKEQLQTVYHQFMSKIGDISDNLYVLRDKLI